MLFAIDEVQAEITSRVKEMLDEGGRGGSNLPARGERDPRILWYAGKGLYAAMEVHEKVADRDYRHRFQGSYSGFIRTHNERQPRQYHASGDWGLVPRGGTSGYLRLLHRL